MEPFTYKFSPRHVPFMKEQIWEARHDLGVYSDLAVFEFSQFEGHIGAPKTVLEVGCGLGRGSIFLNHLLHDDDTLFVLADRTGYTSNSGAFNPEVDEFYNDLELTADFCQQNGIKKFRTFDTEVDDWATLPKADLIFSLCSFGMHVPIERYIDRLIAGGRPTSTMIFGTRSADYGQTSFKERFQEVLYIPGEVNRGIFPVENWLILKNPLPR